MVLGKLGWYTSAGPLMGRLELPDDRSDWIAT